MTVVCSVDVEEDNWRPARAGVTVENIRELPRLTLFLDRLGARATYFTSYAVVREPWAAELVREAVAGGRVEAGAHLHPWNTPPVTEPDTPRSLMLCNLPRALQAAKLAHLTAVHAEAFGRAPRVFRAGKFGIGPSTIGALLEAGYEVDSSVAPFLDLSAEGGADFSGAPLGVYRVGAEGDVRVPAARGGLLEVPVSCGYTRLPFERWHAVHQRLVSPLGLALRAPGIASRTGLVRKVVMSPELDSAADMLSLASRLVEQGVPFVHLFLHSTTLRPGLTPYASSAADVDALLDRVEQLIEGLARVADVSFATVSEVAGRSQAPVPPRAAHAGAVA